MGQLKALLPGLINGLIIIPVVGIIVGFWNSEDWPIRLGIFNVALIVIVILLMVGQRFTRQRIRVAQTQGQPHVYLIENKTARHIPDPPTFEYLGKVYGFYGKDIEVMSDYSFRKSFSNGSVIPSILPHCRAYHEEIINQQSQPSRRNDSNE